MNQDKVFLVNLKTANIFTNIMIRTIDYINQDLIFIRDQIKIIFDFRDY